MLRDIAEGIARYIRDDHVLHDDGHVTVVVEDKADVGFEIQQALGRLGVCVLVAITGFRRVDGSPVLQGTVEIQVSFYEHPSLNRDDLSVLTAQGACERVANILHYHHFPFLVGQMIFKDFQRDDVEEANIVRANFEVNTHLGYGCRALRTENETPKE